MTEPEIHDLTRQLFSEALKQFGFEDVEVRIGVDADGDEFLDIAAHYGARGRLPTPQASISATSLLRQALLARGEERFPNVLHIGSVADVA